MQTTRRLAIYLVANLSGTCIPLIKKFWRTDRRTNEWNILKSRPDTEKIEKTNAITLIFSARVWEYKLR